MKVYLVCEVDYDHFVIVAAFASRTGALDEKVRLDATKDWAGVEYAVEEHEVLP